MVSPRARWRPGERDMSRREFLRLSGAGLAGATLLGTAGCAGFTPGEGAGPNTLVFTMGPDDSGVLESHVDKFNKQGNSDMTVQYRPMPADTGLYFDKLRTEFQAGEGPDVIGGDVIWPAQFAANGWIADLSEFFGEDEQSKFVDSAIRSNTYDGKIYGVPWYTDAGMLYFRKDLLEKAGFNEPPSTWDELREMATKTAKDQDVRYGFVFQGANYEGGVVNGLEYIWNSGGDVLDPDDRTKVTIDNDAAASGLEQARKMLEEGASPEVVVTYKEDESHSAFLLGNAVFLRNWPYVFAMTEDPVESKIKPETVDVTSLPVEGGNESVAGLGGWNFFINEGTDHKEQAFEFIKFMTAEEQQRTEAIDATHMPTRKALYQDQKLLEEQPLVGIVEQPINSTRPRPVSPVYSDLSLEMSDYFNRIYKGEISPADGVAQLQRRLQSIVDQAPE